VLPTKWSSSDMLLSNRLESCFVDKHVGCPASWTWRMPALCQANFVISHHHGQKVGAGRR
jgi:hypothetical protein